MDLGRSLGAETLEVRALLSGQTVQLIKDVNSVELYPSSLTPAGTNLFFEVEDSTHTGVELVVENSSGSQVLVDTGASSSPLYSYGLSELTAVGNNLFFLAGGGDGNQLWTSDGTVAGTVQVSPPAGTSTYELI